MELNDAINSVKYSLGHPAVKLEIDDKVIMSFFLLAISKALDYSNYTETISRQAQDVIKLEDALNVIRVWDNDSIVTELDDTSLFSYYYHNSLTKSSTMKDLIISQAQSSFLYSNVNKGFKFLNNKLYLYNYTGKVTIEYIPKRIDFCDLESNIQSWCIRYTKCLCKEALGRIRSKYKSNSGPFEMDGDTLLSEYSEERTQLEDELNSSQTGFFFVDTDY